MIAILEAYKSQLFQKKHIVNNIVSGLIVGIVAVPLAMAFAIASGAKPEQGLYTAIFAGFFVSVFGGTRLQISGPTGAFVVILAGITAQYGIEGLQIATLMAGIILVLLGFSKLGSIIKFIPRPVIVGFTAGIGVIIWVSQWKDFFGLPNIEGTHFHAKLFHLLNALPHFQSTTTIVAVSSLLIVIFAAKIPYLKHIPSPLLALIFGTSLQMFLQFDQLQTIGSVFGGIAQGFPAFSIPNITWEKIIDLLGPAFTIAMLGAIESLLSAVVVDGMTSTRHNSNQELIGQGFANIVTPLFGGFAATGAIARTATNIRSGATSPLSGIVHSVTLLIIILLLAPLAKNIPLATLAAILFVVAWHMSDAKHFIRIIKKEPLADTVILLITFFLTIFADLVIAVNIGVIISILYFLKQMATSVEIKYIMPSDIKNEFNVLDEREIPKDVLAFSIEGPFFFGAIENFERAITITHNAPKIIIVRLKWVPFIDGSGLETLEEFILNVQKRHIKVFISGANPRVSESLEKSGIAQLIGSGFVFKDFSQALLKARQLLEDS